MEAAPGAVEARGLVKTFGSLRAVDGLSLSVPAGAFYAFLGPNGAGKSTTLSMLTGVLEASAGEIRILGQDLRDDPIAVKAQVGIVPEELTLFERLTGWQQLIFSGRVYGLSDTVAAKRAKELLKLTGLEGREHDEIAGYSKGMRRRLAIGAALVHAPRVVFLDEPFEGIDVIAAGVVRELLQELGRRGVTVLLTTHVLAIADRLATHAGIIAAGRMLAEGSVEALKARYERDTLEAVFESLIEVPRAPEQSLSFYGHAED
ncbi:MAG: ABC transporter ATP-binding protein [Deltaproteobacteria bacterium]|nr:ABC transporter ATP-binding protein [Deltaproteobacteria bacterium]